ncbi:Uncharacterized membrane protein [Klenkia soli]|uniref:Uncharacterized membrane protein n=1 Tax=Klenkia soli TaxID=1052260 RepID=A0A1H0NKB2_9ACTN|nr:anthrone oxygenase family protein [Klenkia soli]SDO92988.1 Uncharacterized membrane protein [Klenkia soli]
MVEALAVLTCTVVGLMVGVEVAVALFVNPLLLRLPAGPSLQARADGGRVLGRLMPFWYIGSTALAAVLAAVGWGTASGVPALAAAVLLAGSVVLSVVFLVPINDRSTSWTAEDHPVDWREQHHRWDRLHHVRVAVIVTAFVLVAVAGVGV